MALSQFCGAFSVMTYTSTIFEASGSSFNPNVSTIFVGVTQLLGSLASTLFVEKFGRKVSSKLIKQFLNLITLFQILLVLSSIGTGLGLGILAIYSYLDKQGVEVRSYGWIPIFSLSFVVFAASVGVMSLPFIVLTELLPNKVV